MKDAALVNTHRVRVKGLAIPEQISFALKPYMTAYHDVDTIADDIG